MEPEPLGEAFTRMARERPDRQAVTDDVSTWTTAELEAHANRWAHDLAGRGVRPGDFVSIAHPNVAEHYALTLAAWKLGAVPQPVSHKLSAAELAAVLDVVRPPVVAGLAPGTDPGVAPHGTDALTLGHEPDGPDTPPPPAPAPPAWKAPTSGGSTGRPKVIVAGEPGVLDIVASRADVYRIEPDGTFLCTAPLFHNAPYLFSLLALLRGNHVVLMGRFDAARAVALADEHAATWIYAVPTMMGRMVRLAGDGAQRSSTGGYGSLPALPALRTLFHIGAPCPPAVKRAVIEWLGPDRVLEGYAGTEAQARTSITGREWLEHPGSVGRVTGGEIEARTLDGDRRCAVGEVGELWLRPEPGRTTYRYIGAEARARPGGWESLGDMGSFDADGYLYLADRAKDMIVVGGQNVYPAEIEAAVLEHPAVVSVVVVPAPDEDLGSVAHAVVQTDGDVTDADLDAHVAARLSPAKRPRAWRRSAEALRDDAGKVRRSAYR
ncbi:bile acid-coenzyme A ligase [Actinomycetospora succinea]|uniref:Bile acid-coenzyme A ligase n=1 Tax=Actinomycetospora succinea TaxID=663603 RepID=A0A4R6UQE3_9PSEU|nr:AMP-binding protein [Actinomycetospora succinea]TDQ47733.1 bile acid-coenzyme A ligase [Actinomycetospora succinea]